MSTFYQEILAIQEPFPVTVDANQRTLFSCNFMARATSPVDKLEEEIYRLLYDNSLVTGIGTDTFIGPNAIIPKTGPGPFISILRTSGLSPMETHDGSKYQRLSFQIITRALDYLVARNKAIAIWRVLDGTRNTTVTAA